MSTLNNPQPPGQPAKKPPVIGSAVPAPSPGPAFVPASGPPAAPKSGGPVLGLIVAAVVAIPICLLLVCGVGGYLVYASFLATAKEVAAQAAAVKDEQQEAMQPPRLKVDPNDPFAPLNSPEAKQQVENAFGKLADEMKKAADQQSAKSGGQKRGKSRPGSNSSSGSRVPGETGEKQDLPTIIQRLQTGSDDDKRRAAELLSRIPLQSDKQEEVSKALNAMDSDSLRKHALAAVKVWGTKENVPMICKIMQQEAFVKIDCLELLDKFKDERAIEPLITMLNEAFREGDRAEEILADWWPQTEQPLVKHLHDKQDRIRERTQRILQLRKADPVLLVSQTVEDLKSTDRDVRRHAIEWLSKQDVGSEKQPVVAAAALTLLSDSSGDIRRNATQIFGKYAQKDQADELLRLLDGKDHEQWKAGLTGLIRLKDVRVAERIGRRKEIRGEAFRAIREAGSQAEDIAARIFNYLEVKDWGTVKEVCQVLGDIGSSKSVGVLQQVKKRAVLAKTPFVPEAADKAIENIRRRR